jgi:hypothetical protein
MGLAVLAGEGVDGAIDGGGVMQIRKAVSVRRIRTLLSMVALGGLGCADSDDVVVGSGNVVERVEPAMFVEGVRISLPLRALVYDGEPRQIVLRGEDNLLEQIDVREDDVGQWQISASQKVMFEQHEDIRIEVPYIDMVELSFGGDVELGDDPTRVWRTDAGADAAL